MSLTTEAEGELATDLGAVEALCALYPDEVPHPQEVAWRLGSGRRQSPREQAFLTRYVDLAEAHRIARNTATFEAFLDTLGGEA